MQKLFFILSCAVILFSCSTTKELTAPVIVPTDKMLTEETVNINTIKGHIYYLASDEMAGRDTPSPELDIAARYLATSLMRFGVKPIPALGGYMQPLPMKRVSPPALGRIEIGSESMTFGKDFILLKGGNEAVEADFIFLDRATREDFEKSDVSGKVVVAIAGYEGQSNPQEWFFAGAEKRKLAAQKGAKALVELYNSPQFPFSFLASYFSQPQTVIENDEDNKMAHIWLNTSNTTAIELLKSDGTKGKIMIEGMEETPIKTANVVGMIEGTDPTLKNEYIIYSAHYDHVGIGRADARGDSIYNGARDNAVGTVTVLSAAENIAKHPTKRSAIFIFFTGEEKGLLGSAYYADNPPIPLDKVVYCFNSDNGGYNDTTIASIIGLTRTDAEPLIQQACAAFGLKAMEDAAPEEGLFDRSDNVNFAKKGVPAPTFSLGFTAFDDEINKYYHQPGDEPATLDYDYLYKFFQSYVYSCRLIANTNQSLFWKEGDKYYEIGTELYKE